MQSFIGTELEHILYVLSCVMFLCPGTEVIQVNATDLDEPGSDNSIIKYSIQSQDPQKPNSSLFTINPDTGVITVGAAGLDSQVRFSKK